jgi:hypothetical protein
VIAKKIPNPKKAGTKAARATGLMAYIAAPEQENGREKCVHFEAVNFLTAVFAAQKLEMIALSQEATKSRDPIDHWVLSFRPGERPSVAQAREAVAIFIAHCGLQGHMHVWGMHDDTGNAHIHIGVNRVHPETLKVVKINKGFDREAAQQAIALIEDRQGWQKEAGARYDIDAGGRAVRRASAPEKVLAPSTRVKDMELQTGEKSLQRLAQEVAAPLIRAAASWKELHARLAAADIRYEREGSGAKLYLGSAAIGIKASDVDRKASFSQLQKRLGPYQPSREITPHEYHHHAQEPHAIENGEERRHGMRRLSECNLARLAPQGQADRTRVLQIDARAGGPGAERLRRAAGRGPDLAAPQPLRDRQAGWREYQAIRDQQKAAKEAETLSLRQRHDRERQALTARTRAERDAALQGSWEGKGILRNAMQSILAIQSAALKVDLAEQHRAERAALRERYRPLPLYKAWQEQAQIVGLVVRPAPDQEASRAQQPTRLSQALRALSHTIDRRGHITYRAAGKDMFRDEGRVLAVLDVHSEQAIAMALATAQQKFGNVLTLTGSAAFQGRAVAVAVAHNLNVRFTDPALNQLGDQLRDEKLQADRDERARLAAVQRLEAERAAERATAAQAAPIGAKLRLGLEVTGFPAFRHRVAELAPQSKVRVAADPGMQAVSLQRETGPAVEPPATGIEVVPEVSRRRGAKPADEEHGQYQGRVLGRDAEYVYQDLGRGATVKHRIAALQAHLPDVEKIREVKYRAGGVRIALQRDTGKEKEK